MASDSVEFVDLRGNVRTDLLRGFIRLYDETFTDPSEREDPSGWESALQSAETSGESRVHLLIARSFSAESILGGLLFEYFPVSASGLLAYLVVAPEARGKGVARGLVRRAIRILEDEAVSEDRALQAVFAETEDPNLVAHGSFSPSDRLYALHGLGARWIDVPYIQPELTPGAGRCRHLLLAAFDRGEERESSISGGAVRAFLREFYEYLGVSYPDSDPDLQATFRALKEENSLRDLREKAVHA